MKKIFYVALSALFLTSCGKEKREKQEEEQDGVQEVESTSTDQYLVLIEAVYEKSDSLVIFYQKQGYFLYDNPIGFKVQGKPNVQKLEIPLPKGEFVENIKIMASTNPQQSHIKINNISLLHSSINVLMDGSDNKHYNYFMADEGFKWDDANQQLNLDHTKKYPPTLTGNDKILNILTN